MADPLSAPILFTHNCRAWVAQQWPTSDARVPSVWQYKPQFPERGLPTLSGYWAARAYFERGRA
jgi:hypothetical protein